MSDLAAELLNRHATALERFSGHRFFQDASSGRLATQVRDRYFCYERLFVRHAANIVAILLAKAPDLSAQRHLNKMLHGLLHDQLEVFDKISIALGLNFEQQVPHDINAFCVGMTEIASAGTYVEGIAAMFVAETTYARVSCNMMQKSPPPDPHMYAWFLLHAELPFLEGAEWLANELNRHGSDAFASGRLDAAVICAIALEVKFHDAAYL